MNILHCEFNDDTACVEIIFTNTGDVVDASFWSRGRWKKPAAFWGIPMF